MTAGPRSVTDREAPDQVALDEVTAEDAGITEAAVRRCADSGDCADARAHINFLQHEPVDFDVVGIFKFGSAGNLAGATLAAFDIPTAQEMMNRVDQFDVIRIAGDEGVAQTQLQRSVREAVRGFDDPRLEVLTGEQLAQDTSDEIRDNLSFFNTFLLVFAIIALFVGAFIIYNTFSIIVAQRARELGLLRALGASGGQVTGSVAIEAFVVGLLSSILGLGLGILVALGLQALMRAIGFGLPSGSLVIEPRTIIISLVVGTVITFVSAIAPARRAARVAPMAALRTDMGLPSSGGRRFGIGAALGLLGIVFVVLGFVGVGESFPGGVAAAVGIGAALGLRRRGDAEPAHRRTDGSLPRLVARQGARHVGRARPRERRPEPAAHRVHGGRADDRHRDRRGGGDLRVVDQDDVERRARERREGRVLAGVDRVAGSCRSRPRPRRRSATTRRSTAPPSPSSASGSSSSTATRRRLIGVEHQPEPHASTSTRRRARTRSGRARAASCSSRTSTTTSPTPRSAPASSRCDTPDTPRGETVAVPIAGTFAEKGAIGNDYLLAMRDYAPHYAVDRSR